MKFKFWQSEFEFDKEDAKIAVPIILLILGLAFTHLPKDWLLGGVGAYYLLYFFLLSVVEFVTKPLKDLYKRIHAAWVYKCPYCKSREIILQGYQGYHSDEHYPYYICNRCRETSVFVNERLIKAGPEPRSIPD
jgi:hypothetical protein